MADLQTFFEQAILQATGAFEKVIGAKRLSGGDINHAARLETPSGVLCIKWQEKEFPGMFEREAEGLKLLREAEVIGVPEVIGFGKVENRDFIMLEFIQSGKRKEDFWEDFGRSLAQLHLCTSANFGLSSDNYIGSLNQKNTQMDDWVEFFIENRLNQQVQMGIDRGAIPKSQLDDFEVLYQMLPNLIPTERPALIHGDLWSGNFMTGPDGKAWIYDPAVHYAHREMDLAFTHLFGGFDKQFYQTYHQEYPLLSGVEDRISIYQLYPLLVHVNLFGGGYLNSVKQILSRFI